MLNVMEPPNKKISNRTVILYFIVMMKSELSSCLYRILIQQKQKREQTVHSNDFYGKTNLDYWYYEEPELDWYLSKFWFGVRKNLNSDYESDTEDPECQKLINVLSQYNEEFQI